MDGHVAHAEHAHASAGKYVQIAVILFVLTALEVLLYEVCYSHDNSLESNFRCM